MSETGTVGACISAPDTNVWPTQRTTVTLLDLLFSAPDDQVATVQQAIRQVAASDWRGAAQTLSYAADWYDKGHEWADAAETLSHSIRAKA